MDINLIKGNTDELEKAIEPISEQAANIVVNSADSYEMAGLFLKDIKTYIKKAKDYWSPIKKAASEAHKKVCEKEKEMLSAPTQAEKTVADKMAVWYRAEQARIEAVRREEERKRKEETDRLLAEAAKAEDEGDLMNADINMFFAEAIESAPMIAPQAAVKVSGITTRVNYKAVVVDASKVPVSFNGLELRPINMSALNQLARTFKSTDCPIEGVKFVADTTVVGSR